MRYQLRIFEDFLALLYPRLCLACEKNIPPRWDVICITCQHFLPKTKFHLERENPFTEHFWGRVPIHAGASLYHFVKGGRTQELIHKLKYNGKREVGIKLGHLYGRALKSSPYFSKIDLIIPVPLHPRKEKIRGYNQSSMFAMGLSETMEIPWSGRILLRTEMTTTQTKKSRLERLENVREAFHLKNPKTVRGKHLLLVDDVMTTGATLEACAEKILEAESAKVSFATIAFAQRK